MSSRIGIIKETNSILIKDPSNLKDIEKNSKKLAEKGCSILVLDSISNLIDYLNKANDSVLSSFFESLALNLPENGKIIFVCYEQDIENYSLANFVSLFNKFIKPHRLFCM